MRIQAAIRTESGPEILWYDLDERFAPFLITERVDGFAVAALLIAMERGARELVLEGPVSERLLHNLTRQLMPVLRLVVPELHAVAVLPTAVDASGQPAGRGVVTGFAGGVDSFCTVAEYLAPGLPGYGLTHLLFCNVGSHGRKGGGRRLFGERWNHVKDFGSAVGLDTVRVDSNLDDLLETRFERTHVPRNASVALLLQGLFAKFLYSSTYRFQDCYIGESKDLSFTDPAAVHLLSTESFESISTGCQYSRVEKTRIALRIPQVRQILNVCVNPARDGRNCSACFKCLRTLSTLDLLGVLDEFGDVFDLNAYRRWSQRGQYLMLLPGRTDDPFIREIYEFARQPEARLPRVASLVHDLWPAVRVPWGIARAVKRLLASAGTRLRRRS